MNPTHLISSFGTLGLIAIIFAETGIFLGFFLPGDSLLVIAGVLSSPGKHTHNLHLNLGAVLVGCFVAAALGAEFGYFLGRKAGPTLFKRPESRLFKPSNVDRAEEFFGTYGNIAIVLARFIPVIRTFVNPVAGVSKMDAKVFTIFNVLGAALWTVGVTMLGYVIGDSVKDTILIPIVVVVSLLPLGYEYLKHRNKAAA